jgi:hypothetical protein
VDRTGGHCRFRIDRACHYESAQEDGVRQGGVNDGSKNHYLYRFDRVHYRNGHLAEYPEEKQQVTYDKGGAAQTSPSFYIP